VAIIGDDFMDDSARNEEKIPFGAPGMPPRWTSGAKDGLITANSAASPVWATISQGIVNEVYYPTIDRPQVRDLQLIITDGESFVHDEQYDLHHETACIPCEGGASLAYRTINRALRITKISRLENGTISFPRHFQAIFTHYPYFICVFPVFLAFFVGFGRMDPYLVTDCSIKQVNRRML
jgi:hypothetical protein